MLFFTLIHKNRMQFFINSSRTKAVFPFNSIPAKNTIKFKMASASWSRGSLQRLYIFFLFYILLRGLATNETIQDLKVNPSSLFVAKMLSQPSITTSDVSSRRTKSESTTPLSLKLAKTCRFERWAQECIWSNRKRHFTSIVL